VPSDILITRELAKNSEISIAIDAAFHIEYRGHLARFHDPVDIWGVQGKFNRRCLRCLASVIGNLASEFCRSA
jgi:hypothetical protein